MLRLLAVAILCLSFSACGHAAAGGKSAGTEAGKEAVRAWLRENTNTGKWEEVKWWGPIQPPEGGPGEYVRVKIRTESGFGGLSLLDLVFWIGDDRIVPRGDGYAIYEFRQRYFEGVVSEKEKRSAEMARGALELLPKKKPARPSK